MRLPGLSIYFACAAMLFPQPAAGQRAFAVESDVTVRADSFACKETSELDRLLTTEDWTRQSAVTATADGRNAARDGVEFAVDQLALARFRGIHFTGHCWLHSLYVDQDGL